MEDTKEMDVFRETWLRYTAFASDFGEALRPFLTKRVYFASYGLVAAYALADTTSRGMNTYWRTQKAPVASSVALPARCAPMPVLAASSAPKTVATSPVAVIVAESLMWHSLASLAIPGVIINRTVWATRRLVAINPKVPHSLHHALPSLVGLAVIPLVVPHIDEAVTRFMEQNIRPSLPPAIPASPASCSLAAAALPNGQQLTKGTAAASPSAQ